MGRGLSQLQKEILAALEPYPKPDKRGRDKLLARSGDILDAVERPRSPANYVAVKKALDRLAERGLVEIFIPGLATRGMGYLYALPGRYVPPSQEQAAAEAMEILSEI